MELLWFISISLMSSDIKKEYIQKIAKVITIQVNIKTGDNVRKPKASH